MDAQLYQVIQSGATLLTATRRLAHRLQLDYAGHAQQEGKKAWLTPNILTLNTWLSESFKQQRQIFSSAPRLLNDLQTQAIWETIVTQSNIQNLLSPAQASRTALHSWQVLHQYQIPLQQLDHYDSKEVQVFTKWSKEFIHYTQQRNVLDMARVPTWLHQSAFVPKIELHLIGFDFITPSLAQLIAYWQNEHCAVHVHDMPRINSSTQVVSFNDTDDELQAAARWARYQIETGKQRIGVVASNLNSNATQIRRIFSSILAPASRSSLYEYSAAFSISSSSPLMSYPLAYHALLCLQLIQEKNSLEIWGQLFRSPFIAGYEDEVNARALLDISMRQECRDEWTVDEVAQLANKSCLLLGQALQSLDALQKTLHQRALPSEWIIHFNRILSTMGWAQGRTLFSEEQQTRNKFYEVLAQLSALDETVGAVHSVDALQLLRNACQQVRFAPESNDYALNIVDVESAAGMQFDALWVLGVHAGEWPSVPEPDPFIPMELQRKHALSYSSAESCLLLSKQKLQRLVDSATEVILSWPQHNKDLDLRASSLLHWPVVSIDSVPRSNISTLVQDLVIAKPVLETITDIQLPAHPDGLIKQGARVFELQSRCAFKSQAELRLYAKSPEAVQPGISPKVRGKLIHHVLQELWNNLKDANGLRAALESEAMLRAKIDQITSKHARSLWVTSSLHQQRLLQIEVHVAVDVIMALLNEESRREFFSVIRNEVSELFTINSVQIRIQPDRLDQLQDGSQLLIDYKTCEGNKASDWLDINQPGRPRSPQLPLYALAHSEYLCGIAYAVIAPGTTEFRGIANRDGIASNIKNYDKRRPNYKIAKVDSWSQLLVHWREVMSALANQFTHGIATVDPLPNECQYCTLTALCRIKEQIATGVDADEEGGDE